MRVRVARCLTCGTAWNTPVKTGPPPRYCPAHRPRRHGHTNRAKYNAAHTKLRRDIAKTVKAGKAVCWRCGRPIHPLEPWDLGHDDWDPTMYRGPEHRACNRGAAARKKNTGLHLINTNSRAW